MWAGFADPLFLCRLRPHKNREFGGCAPSKLPPRCIWLRPHLGVVLRGAYPPNSLFLYDLCLHRNEGSAEPAHTRHPVIVWHTPYANGGPVWTLPNPTGRWG